MRKIIPPILVLLIIFLFTSCTKQDASSPPKTTIDDQLKQKLNAWLSNERAKVSPDDVIYFDSTVASIAWQKVEKIRLNEQEFGIIFPLEYQSHKNEVLFFKLLNDESVQSAYVWQITENSSGPKTSNQELFGGIIEDERSTFSGLATMLTTDRKFLVEIENHGGEKTKFKIIEPDTINSSNGKVEGCLAWYYVFYLNGVEIGRQYIGTTCDGSTPCTKTYYSKTQPGTLSFRINCGGGGGGGGSSPGPGGGTGSPSARDKLCPDTFIWSVENGGYYKSTNVIGLRFVNPTNPTLVNTFNNYVGFTNFVKESSMYQVKTSPYLARTGNAFDFLSSFQNTKGLFASGDIAKTTVVENGLAVTVYAFSKYACTTIATMAASMAADGVLFEYGNSASIPGSVGPKATFTEYFADIISSMVPGSTARRSSLNSAANSPAHYGNCF